jgi:hypothetical protein
LLMTLGSAHAAVISFSYSVTCTNGQSVAGGFSPHLEEQCYGLASNDHVFGNANVVFDGPGGDTAKLDFYAFAAGGGMGVPGMPGRWMAFVSGVFEFGTPGVRRNGLALVSFEYANSVDYSVYNAVSGYLPSSPSLQPFMLGVPFRVALKASLNGFNDQPFLGLLDNAQRTVRIRLFEADGVTPVTALWDVPASEIPEPRLTGAVLAAMLIGVCRRRTAQAGRS